MLPTYLTRVAFPLLATVALTTVLFADYREEIGFFQLEDELGPAMPTGQGVSMVQAEAAQGDSDPPSILPDPDRPEFSGVQFSYVWTDSNGDPLGAISGHANSVGRLLYGDADLASNVTDVIIYYADRWIGQDYLNIGALPVPRTDRARVHNHSWVGSVSNDGSPQALQRYDYAIDRDGIFAAVGTSNGRRDSIPELLSPSHNAITVGMASGNHGATVTTFDGDARVKPDIVVPQVSNSSSATPIVAASGALLLEHADNNPQLERDAGSAIRPETLRAVLMAGATKFNLADPWSNSETQPLDRRYGVGALNLRNAFYLFDAGETDTYDENPQPLPYEAWDYGFFTSDDFQPGNPQRRKRYLLSVPPNMALREFSLVLTWNRRFNLSPTARFWNNPAILLPNLAIEIRRFEDGNSTNLLYRSDSPGGTVEHLFVNLAPGDYLIEVVSPDTDPANFNYALAWRGLLGPLTYFDFANDLALDNPAIDSLPPDEDFDNDGNNNLTEFGLTTDLLKPEFPPVPDVSFTQGSGPDELIVSIAFRRREDSSPLTYHIDESGDLFSWNDQTATYALEQSLPDENGFRHVTYSRTLSTSEATRLFFRLRVEDPTVP